MKNILLKLICIFTLTLGLNTSTKAQLVYIPDSAFRAHFSNNFAACMVGDSVDPTCPDFLNVTYLYLNNRGIYDLSGVELFTNITELVCYNNFISSLPVLPPNIEYLDCSNNQISSITSLPSSLTVLNIDNNQLTTISSLPPTLNSLYCPKNQLTSLPPLSASLKYLNCNENQLTSLPSLPDSLLKIYCENNLLTSLPPLNIQLEWLICNYNQLTSLPAITNNLKILHCFNNQITNLPILINSWLKKLNCSNNQITSLPAISNKLEELFLNNNPITFIPPLTNNLIKLSCANTLIDSLPNLVNLKYLDCHSNQLLSLPSLPTYMTYLDCSKNQITTLPGLPNTLQYLDCSFNQIDSLPSLMSVKTILDCSHNLLTKIPVVNVDSLYCGFNQLTSINPQLFIYLRALDCRNNQITEIPKFGSGFKSLYCQNNPITCLQKIQFLKNLDISGTQINCLLDYGTGVNSNPPVTSFPICDVFNTNGCELFWNIGGKAFIDTDLNCYVGATEPNYVNQKISLYKNGILDQITYTTSTGNYDFNTETFDNYRTEIDTTDKPFQINCPLTGFYLDTLTALDSMKYDRNFGVKCKGIDLAVTNINSPNIRPASIREIKIQAGDYSNYFGSNCAMGISGTVSISIIGACNYLSPAAGALIPNSIIGNVLSYNVSNFGILSFDSSFNFNILVDTTAVLGSQICIQFSISTKANELTYDNNFLTQCFTVVGSNDPNDKTAFPNSFLDNSGDRWITYLIRFQNTGTADAEDIFITDTLSQSLDWSTFTLLSYSHLPITQIYNDGLVKFNFPKIHLPDSTTNEPASHGYVQYKIRAKDSLTIGSTIENTASIYFDFNAPVTTNTSSNVVINCSIPPTIITASICHGDAYSLNGVNYYSDGIYSQKLITSVGCDSLIELHLSIKSISINSFTVIICIGNTYNFNGQILTTSGLYSDTLLNYLGCDSIINLQLFSITGAVNYITALICDGNTYNFNGQILSQPGTYTDSLLNFIGCDSIVHLQLIVSSITNSISQSSAILQTTASGSGYQWIDCATNTAIAGATNSTYQPTQSGNYAVAVTYGNCIDTSTCFAFSMVGLPSSIGADVIFQTRYHSNSDQIHIHAEKLKGNKGLLRLMDISGRIIFQKQIENIATGNLDVEIPAKGMNAGIYLVNLITERDNISGKVVKY